MGCGVCLSEQADIMATVENIRIAEHIRRRLTVLEVGDWTDNEAAPLKSNFRLCQFDPCGAVAAAFSGFWSEVADGAMVSQVFADHISERSGSSTVYYSKSG